MRAEITLTPALSHGERVTAESFEVVLFEGRHTGMIEWFGFETTSVREIKISYNLPFKLSYIIPKFSTTKITLYLSVRSKLSG
ncbi:MAG: hypothetical protein IPL67_08750 [Ignavibacteria bacterium]|nr:hypothetical protein [Ignavibacteria bacterium]